MFNNIGAIKLAILYFGITSALHDVVNSSVIDSSIAWLDVQKGLVPYSH